MTKKVRALLIVSGLIIFFSWGFRLYVVSIRWGTDRFSFFDLFIVILYFVFGIFLLWMAKRGAKCSIRDYTVLLYAAVFTILWWIHRWTLVMLHPEKDPNPRAHLHLASLFIVIGALLLLVGWKGRKRMG